MKFLRKKNMDKFLIYPAKRMSFQMFWLFKLKAITTSPCAGWFIFFFIDCLNALWQTDMHHLERRALFLHYIEHIQHLLSETVHRYPSLQCTLLLLASSDQITIKIIIKGRTQREINSIHKCIYSCESFAIRSKWVHCTLPLDMLF